MSVSRKLLIAGWFWEASTKVMFLKPLYDHTEILSPIEIMHTQKPALSIPYHVQEYTQSKHNQYKQAHATSAQVNLSEFISYATLHINILTKGSRTTVIILSIS